LGKKAEKSDRRTPPARGFPDSEFEGRLSKAQMMMASARLDALLLTTEPEVRYFTGFLTQFWQSPTRPWFLIVPLKGKPIAVIPGIGADCMSRTWIEDIRTWSSPHAIDDGIGLLADTLSEIADPTGRVGVPMGRETHMRLPLSEYARLKSMLTGMDFVDASPIVRQLRMVKSEAEIEKIAYICGVASDTFAEVPGLVGEGDTEIEVFRRFKRQMLKQGADDCPFLVGGAGLGGYSDIISPPSDRPLQSGDVLILDTGAVFDGYFCDFDRNFAIGKADDAAKRAYEVVYDATEVALTACRPGITTTDLYHAMWQVLEEGGALSNDVGRLGHGLGMQLTEWPSHTDFDGTILEEGMVLTIEPGIEFAPGKLMVHEENIVVRDGPPQLLTTRAEKQLPVIS
jgi:Xaa-Pro aminopeptidase